MAETNGRSGVRHAFRASEESDDAGSEVVLILHSFEQVEPSLTGDLVIDSTSLVTARVPCSPQARRRLRRGRVLTGDFTLLSVCDQVPQRGRSSCDVAFNVMTVCVKFQALSSAFRRSHSYRWFGSAAATPRSTPRAEVWALDRD